MPISPDTSRVTPSHHTVGDLEQARQIAHRSALRIGLSPCDAEDCACTFIMKLLQRSNGLPDIRLLHRQSLQHAIDYWRMQNRRFHFESADPDACDADRLPGVGSCPVTALLRRTLLEHLHAAVHRLQEEPRALYEQCVLQNASIADLARCHGKSENAIRQILKRAIRRVRTDLERHGITEADFRQAFCLPRKCR